MRKFVVAAVLAAGVAALATAALGSSQIAEQRGGTRECGQRARELRQDSLDRR